MKSFLTEPAADRWASEHRGLSSWGVFLGFFNGASKKQRRNSASVVSKDTLGLWQLCSTHSCSIVRRRGDEMEETALPCSHVSENRLCCHFAARPRGSKATQAAHRSTLRS